MFRNYENKFGKRQYGTWEWLFGEDYNYNNNVDDTVEAMEKIANAREDLYKFTDDNDTIYTYKLPYDSNATEEIENRKLKYGENFKILRNYFGE